MKHFYYIIDISENNKNYCYVAKIAENTNLLSTLHFTRETNISITPCETYKKAKAIAEAQNAMYKHANIYLFDGVPLF